MLTAEEYGKLVQFLQSRQAEPLTSLEAYLACHHLPNWYRESPSSRRDAVLPRRCRPGCRVARPGLGQGLLEGLREVAQDVRGLVISKPEDAAVVLAEMKKFRGTIEGGISVRRFEVYRERSEVRYFVIRGAPYAASGAVPDLVAECARRISSPFSP